MKTAIIVMSDPKNGSEEALGRVFNALALAAECKQEDVYKRQELFSDLTDQECKTFVKTLEKLWSRLQG